MKAIDQFPKKTVPVYLFILVIIVAACNTNKPDKEHAITSTYRADSIYIQQGNSMVAQTFDTLRNSLLHAISTGGLDGAISFCNEKAYPITSVYADSVVIRRTALRVRNPANQPDSIELLMLNELLKLHQSAQTLPTKVIRQTSTGEIHYFKPILLQAMCLNCHGTPEIQIPSPTLDRIKNFYPDDQAVNFKEGDLRGIWHIIFKE